MFCSLARLRVITFSLILFFAFAYSREESLFTSSVTYCDPPETLLIQQFDVAYIAKNQSILFNISAASVQPNVSVTANLLLNVYGKNPVNVTLDLCHILGGALCPLPMYNFTGSDSISLPETLGVSNKVPGIAFKIPDLEGFVQLTLRDVRTGELKACVQATLSNGWSAHQHTVELVTALVTLAALLSAAWQSLSPEALAPFRLLDLLHLYQTIASTSFLGLNYPSVYRAFTLNFAWAMGLFSTSPSSSLQQAINRMRHLTGGKLADANAGSAVGLVNRKLSPYNAPESSFVAATSLLARAADYFNVTVLKELLHTGAPLSLKLHTDLAQQSATPGGVQTVTAASRNVLQAGVPIYVNSIYIATANAFVTVLICTLILIAIAFGVFILAYGVLFALGRWGRGDQDRVMMLMRTYPSFAKAWGLRLGLIVFSPILIFVFYQWTLKDSWLSVFLAVITFLGILALVSYPTYLVLTLAHHTTREALYSDSDLLASNGPLYAQYRSDRYYFSFLLLTASLIKAIVIAAGKGNGEAQIIIVLVLETAVLASYIIFKPYKTRGGDIFSTYLAIVRLVCTGLMIAFVQRLKVAAIPRVVIGIVIAIIFSVTVIVTIINLVLHSGINWLYERKRFIASSDKGSSNDPMLEKGDLSSSHSSERISRPVNPTPEQRAPIDPSILQPYLISPTATSAGDQSVYSRDSGTITVGSLLPRRWSFSQPNSPANSSLIHEVPSYNSPSSTILFRQSETAPHLQQQ